MYMESDPKEPSAWLVLDEDIDNELTNRGGGDLNDRGRGRSVETQGSGLAVVRAMWEFLRRMEGDADLGL
jgi:hypothetical protein